MACVAAAATIGALGLLPALASAHRPAKRSEAAAMIYAASGRYYGGTPVSEPRAVPLRCFVADISTVGTGSDWGAWTFSRYAYAHERACHAGNGIAIEHRIAGRWYVLWEGDEGYPPTRRVRTGALTLQPVPRAVARDLKAGLAHA